MQNYAKTQYFLVKKYNDLKNKTKFSTTNASFFVIVTLYAYFVNAIFDTT